MAGLTPRDHTAAVLKRMNLAGSVPGNIDRNNDAQSDNYGLTAAQSSDASSFKMTGAPKAPHLGRPGRQAGGRIAGELLRTRRTPQETAKDIADEDAIADELGKDRGRATGGRTSYAKGGRAKGKTTVNVIIGGDKHMAPQGMPPPMPPPPMAAPGPVGPPPGGMPPPPGPLLRPPGMPIGGAPMGPAGAPPPGAPPMLRARGGRIGKQLGGSVEREMASAPGGLTGQPSNIVRRPNLRDRVEGGSRFLERETGPNVFSDPGDYRGTRNKGGRVGRQMGGAMPAPGLVRPPVAPPAMPPQGMGSPLPPGVQPPMPMRAKGGRIEIGTPGKHDYGKPGVKHGSTDEKYGGGSGLGRQERARHQK